MYKMSEKLAVRSKLDSTSWHCEYQEESFTFRDCDSLGRTTAFEQAYSVHTLSGLRFYNDLFTLDLYT